MQKRLFWNKFSQKFIAVIIQWEREGNASAMQLGNHYFMTQNKMIAVYLINSEINITFAA